MIRPPAIPESRDHTEIIEMIEELIRKNHAYVSADGVYFEIDTAPEKWPINGADF